MHLNRRNILIAAAAELAVARAKAGGVDQTNRVSQEELDEAICLHSLWLDDHRRGKRCTLGRRDLSGLQFRRAGGGTVHLSSADFAGANLSDTEADDILVHHCNFNGATLDNSRWRRPVFAYADMRRASATRAEWGVPGLRGSTTRSPADFSHTVLSDIDLSGARICGHFYGTNLARASVIGADLSESDFLGPIHHEMNLSRAALNGARLRHCHFFSVNFSHADCSDVDFSGSNFSDLKIKDCNLVGAVFRGADFERAVFAPHQVDDLELRKAMTGNT